METADRKAAVEHHGLRVIHAAQQMIIDTPALDNERSGARLRTKSASRWFDFARNTQVDSHAAARKAVLAVSRLGVRNEVGRDRQHALRRMEACVDEERAHGVFGLVRAARRVRAAGGVLLRGDGDAPGGLPPAAVQSVSN